MCVAPDEFCREFLLQNAASLFDREAVRFGNYIFAAGCRWSPEQIFELWAANFPEDADYGELISAHLKKAVIYGIACNDRLISMAAVFLRNIYAGGPGRFVPCGFIVGVSTDMAWRGLGLSGSILRRIQQDMDKNGWQALALSTFIPRFYERFGFAVKGFRRQHSVSPGKADGSVTVKNVGIEAASEICEYYGRFKQNGLLARSVEDTQWKIRFSGQTLALYGKSGLCGYAFRGEDNFFDEFMGDELSLLETVAAYAGRPCIFALPAFGNLGALPFKDDWTSQMIYVNGEDIFPAGDFVMLDDW